MVQRRLWIGTPLGESSQSAVQPGGGGTVPRLHCQTERLFEEHDGLRRLARIGGKSAERREKSRLCPGLTQTPIEIERSPVALTGAGRLALGGVNLAEPGQQARLEFHVVDPPGQTDRPGDGANRVPWLAESPQGIPDAPQPLRLVGRVPGALGQIHGLHQVIQGLGRAIQRGVGDAESSQGSLLQPPVADRHGKI